MALKKIAALGWENCARLSNAQVELIVTLDVGPRILSYQHAGGENVLRAFPDTLGKRGEPKFIGRGGHRLWVAPEGDRTYAPDNAPVKFEFGDENTLHVANPATAPWQVRKEMTISLAVGDSSVVIQHRVTNEGTEPSDIASWGITIMTPGGVAIIPQPPLGEHGKELLPKRVIIPWTYTDLSDDRWKIGRRFFLLEPKADRPSTKLGFSHQRWAAHLLPGALFIKSFKYEDGATYPDLGSNFETFSKGDFIELETLSPLRKLAPGQSVGHTETWHLFPTENRPDLRDEAALEQWLAPFLAQAELG